MPAELKRSVINMKSLDQDIKDPIIVGGGDANGRTLAIMFTQEAAAQITPQTLIYLKWRHQQTDIIGYNVFTQESEKPQIWSIKYPRSMLFEGDVTACIELVDDISISTSVTFNIHVLADPYDSERFEQSDDLTVFQQAAIALDHAADSSKEQMRDQRNTFNAMVDDMTELQQRATQATDDAAAAAERITQIADYYAQGVVEVIEF